MKNLLIALFILTLSVGSYACHMCYSPVSTSLDNGKQHVCASCYSCYYAKTNPYLNKVKVNTCETTDCAGCFSCYSAIAHIPSNLAELKIN